MKFAVYRQELLDAMIKVIRVVPSVKVSPILTYALVELKSDTLNITATDLSNFISVSVPCKSDGHGFALFPAADFLSALKTVKSDGVVVSYDDGVLKLRSGNSGWNWRTLNPESFSKIPEWEQSKVFVVEAQTFIKAATKVKSAVAVDSFSKNLEQIGFINGTLMAADGARFHQVMVNDLDTNIALPTSFVDDLIHILPLLKQDKFEIGLTSDETAVVVKSLNVVLSTKTKLEKFPDLNKAFLIPSMTNYNFVRIQKSELLNSIKRVRIAADKSSRLITLELKKGSSQMSISANQSNGNFATDVLEVECSPQDRQINLNVDYLLQALAVFDQDVIEFKLGNDVKNKPSTLLISQDDRSVVLNQLRV